MSELRQEDPMAAGLRALLPPGYAKTLGFLIPAHEASQELIDWYENEHSVNASFMWPHMRRYQRSYIVNVQRGPSPIYKVISEFLWKGEDDKNRIAALFATDAAAKTVNEVLPDFVLLPFPPGGYFLVPVTEREVSAGARVFAHDELRRRKVVLLGRGAGCSADEFAAKVDAYARELARKYPDSPIAIDFLQESETIPAPADAVLFVDAMPGEVLPDPQADTVEVLNIFDVMTLRSPIEEDR